MKTYRIAEADYTREAVEALREEVVRLRDKALEQGEMLWAVRLSHVVAFMAVAADVMYAKHARIPPISPGYRRQWLRCRTCGKVQYRDFVPYSLSNPIATTTCGHGVGERDLGCDAVSANEALVALMGVKS